MSVVPPCRVVTVHTFRGDRGSAFSQRVFKGLDAQRSGRGPGPSRLDCLLFAGHSGLSTDADSAIHAFNPDGGSDPLWQMMHYLRNGGAYPGIVRDDTAVFIAAQKRGLIVLRFDVALSPQSFQAFWQVLTAEQKQSTYSYGFPDGDGDCNCVTWMERLGLPLLTGRMDEFAAATGISIQVRRRFGACL